MFSVLERFYKGMISVNSIHLQWDTTRMNISVCEDIWEEDWETIRCYHRDDLSFQGLETDDYFMLDITTYFWVERFKSWVYTMSTSGSGLWSFSIIPFLHQAPSAASITHWWTPFPTLPTKSLWDSWDSSGVQCLPSICEVLMWSPEHSCTYTQSEESK